MWRPVSTQLDDKPTSQIDSRGNLSLPATTGHAVQIQIVLRPPLLQFELRKDRL